MLRGNWKRLNDARAVGKGHYNLGTVCGNRIGYRAFGNSGLLNSSNQSIGQ